jgi:hypothetical protein
MQIKRETVFHKLKQQIVPPGAFLIDEEQISRIQLTRQQREAGLSLRTEVRTSSFLNVRDL